MNINAKPARRFANHVNGQDQDGRQGETFESINPTTGAAFGRFVNRAPPMSMLQCKPHAGHLMAPGESCRQRVGADC